MEYNKVVPLVSQILLSDDIDPLLSLVNCSAQVASICAQNILKSKTNKKQKNQRTDNSTIINQYTDVTFSDHFRMSKKTFELLLRSLQPLSKRKELISINIQLMITLWLLATPDSFRSVAHRFGICTDKLVFIDIYFGECVSLHDGRVYQRSPIHNLIHNEKERYLGQNGHLIGDAAYPLSNSMMTPFCDNGHLTDEENHYNYVHSSIRKDIERAFALLKGKWRRLKYLDANSFEYIRDHVLACCILHNFLIIEKDENSYFQEANNPQCEAGVDIDVSDTGNNDYHHQEEEGKQKRNYIAALLYDLEYCR